MLFYILSASRTKYIKIRQQTQTMLFLFLFFLFSISQSSFWDTTCPQHKCTKEKLSERNYAKSLGFGNFSCILSVIVFNTDGSINTTFSIPAGYETFYDNDKGAIVTVTSEGVNEEYCGHDGGICLNETQPSIAAFYTESYDISKGVPGNAARLIQSYEKNKNKGVRRVQHLITRKGGDENVMIFFLDEDQLYTAAAFETCTKVDSRKRMEELTPNIKKINIFNNAKLISTDLPKKERSIN